MIEGSATANLRHMDYNKPKYGNAYARYQYMEGHPPHLLVIPLGTSAFWKNSTMRPFYGLSGGWQGRNMTLLEVGTKKDGRATVGFDVDYPFGNKEVTSTRIMTADR